jgi:hypothetical protein
MTSLPRLPLVCTGVLTALAVAFFAMTTSNADSYSRNVTIINGTSATLVQFYGSAGGGWGHNRLGGAAIAPGGRQSINFDDGSGNCRFNFKSVFANGSERQSQNIDVCQTSSFSVR